MKITVVIPTFNRKDIIRDLLQKLAADAESRSAAEIEVIVANDQSSDGTGEMLREEFPWVHAVLGPGKSPQGAKRAAIEVATGDYIVNLDDDSLPHDGWIAKVMPALLRGEKIVQSKIVFLDLNQAEIADESKAHFRVGFRFDGMPVAVLNGGYREQYLPICHEFGAFFAREILVQTPFDDPNIRWDWGESASFSIRAAKLGYRVFFEPSAVVDHLGALHGGLKERAQKLPPKKICTEYAAKLVESFIILARMRKVATLPLLIPYYLLGGIYLSFRQRRKCYVYFSKGLWKGLTRPILPVVPYVNFR